MNLRELLDGVACEVVQGRPDVEVKMIHFDSRKVGEGDLFVAQRGVSADGHGYIGKAVAAGAVAVVCEEVPGELQEGVVYVKTGNSSEALGVMASNFYGNPSRRMKVVGVTGTNGKTTTTTLLGEIMKASGRQTVVGGNIGIGLSEQAADLPKEAVVVAELSSFQLEFTQTMKAKAAVVLNITPDHLDRHHTMEAYAEAKKRIFRNQDGDDTAVLNYDDPLVRAMAPDMTGRVVWFSTQGEVPVGAFYQDGQLILRMDGQDTLICREDELHLFGKHNIQNCLAASLLAYAAGVPLDVISGVLKSFRGVEHRLEKVRTIHGVTYYNDSKGTNTDASIKALEAFSGHLVLIAGGYDKMTPLDEFMKLAAEKVDTLILIGAAADRFEQEAKKAGVKDIRRAGYSMERAIMMARKIAKAPQAVLLSPACSSFDMYDNFEQRGRVFKGIVNAI